MSKPKRFEEMVNAERAKCHTRPAVSHRLSHHESDASPDGNCGSDEVSHCHTVTPGEYKGFPTDALPFCLGELSRKAAMAIGCDPAFVAVPGLAALASAIGATRVVEVKQGWCEPSILWGVTVGESSDRKSPAFDVAVAPVVEVQDRHFRDYAADRKAHQQAREHGETRESPICRRVWMDDTTLDAVAPVLRDNPRGVLIGCEELDAWFQSFTRYSSGGATDQPRWLKLYGGRPLTVDRKAGGVIAVRRAVASLTGTIQPGTLSRALTRAARDSGLAARLLFAMPPRAKMRWTDATIPPDATRRYGEAVRLLLEIPLEQYADGNNRPHPLPLSSGAKRVMREHVDATGELMDDSPHPDERAAMGKLVGTAARLALVVELASSADPGSVAEVSEDAMHSGVCLARWFGAEMMRVYATLSETGEEKDDREIIDWIRRKGGEVTARDLQRHNQKRFRKAGDADAVLEALVAAKLGAWVADARPRRFRLTRCDSVTV